MFDWFYKLLGSIISFFNSITGNYLVAVLLFALLFKLILFPFSVKQQKNMVKQASLAPKKAAIEKKYKGRDDQDSRMKMQQEISEMYRNEGYNAFGGCLPLLLQLPLLLALYSIIRAPLTYICGLKDVLKASEKGALSIAEKLKDLTGGKPIVDEMKLINWLSKDDNLKEANAIVSELPDKVSELPNFDFFGIDLSIVPTEGWAQGGINLLWLLMPVLTFVFMYGSMKLTRKFSYQPEANDPNMGCSMKVMDLSMPLMSTFLAATMPALMGAYWLFSNVIGVVQQMVLKFMFPYPVFTEEDYKEAERLYRGKGHKVKPVKDPRVVEGKQYRSLHHIDDEEEEAPSLPPMKIDLEEEEEPRQRPANAPKLKDDNPDYRKKKK